MSGARNVTVVPVASEQGLRTRAWVESNRRLVEKLSNGQLAERAVAEAMRMLKERPVHRAVKEPPPPTWGRRP